MKLYHNLFSFQLTHNNIFFAKYYSSPHTKNQKPKTKNQKPKTKYYLPTLDIMNAKKIWIIKLFFCSSN